jgi:hypothetical protein
MVREECVPSAAVWLRASEPPSPANRSEFFEELRPGPLPGPAHPPSRPVRWVLVISCLSVQTISFVSTFTQFRINR